MKIIFIDHEDPDYWRVAKAISRCSARHSQLVFFGAGISAPPPASLPLSPTLCEPLLRMLEESTQRIMGSTWPKEHRELLHSALTTQPLESLLGALLACYGPSALNYLSVLESTSWNDNHALIAAFMRAGYWPYVITLNFDVLIELALRSQHVSFSVICPLAGDKLPTDQTTKVVLKPHGTLAMEGTGNDRFNRVSATLNQVGAWPSPLNREALTACLSKYPSILFAGYSDNDWDIFPLFIENVHLLSSVIWVQHAIPSKDLTRGEGRIPKRVRLLLSKCPETSVVLCGDIHVLMKDCARLLGLEHEKPSNHRADTMRLPSAEWFSSRPELSCFSAAMLMPSTKGDVKLNILHRLLGASLLGSDPRLLALLHRTIGNEEHTAHRMESAIMYNKRALHFRAMEPEPDRKIIADDIVWLGYEYLCLAKRPSLRYFRNLIRIPSSLAKGLYLLREGRKRALEVGSTATNVVAMSFYYPLDLLHSLASLAMIVGRPLCRILAPLFWVIQRHYKRLARDFPDHLADGYYWLRWMEAAILSGSPLPIDEIKGRLADINFSYEITQNDPQFGNASAYEALLRFANKEPRSIAKSLLATAEAKWRSPNGCNETGLLRVTLFRRYIGLIAFLEAVQQLTRHRAVG